MNSQVLVNGLSTTCVVISVVRVQGFAPFPLDICMEFFADTATSYGFTNQDQWKISGCTDLMRSDP